MGWDKEFFVSLIIEGYLRIGGGRGGLISELPLSDKYNLPSSFKGVLRKSIRRVIQSINLSCYSDVETRLFGSRVGESGEEALEGKLLFELSDFKTSGRKILTGIRIDPSFGSVKSGALFDYEVYQTVISLTFIIRPMFELTDEESAILLAGLKSLTYDSIGSFASRGIGIIKRVDIKSDFGTYAESHLRKLVEG